jgi:hypothetical protein
MNTHQKYKIMAILSYAVSGYFTVLLFNSMCTDVFSHIPMTLIAIIFEVAKWILMKEIRNYTGFVKSVLITILGFTIMYSVIASAGYVINKNNESKKDEIESSVTYQNQVASKSNKADLYTLKKKEFDTLVADEKATLTRLENGIKSLPSDYITAKINQGVELNKQTERFETAISKKSAELSLLVDDLSKNIDTSGASTLSTTGYSPIFKMGADFLNASDKSAKKNPYQATSMELFFFLSLGIGLEILANVFAHLSNSSNYVVDRKINPVDNSKNPVDNKPQLSIPCKVDVVDKKPKLYKIKGGITAKSSNINKIGFVVDRKNSVVDNQPILCTKTKVAVVDNRNFTDSDVSKYLEVMNNTKTQAGYSKGFKYIGSKIGLDNDTSEKIHGYLCTKGLVVVEGTRTKILVEANNIKEA